MKMGKLVLDIGCDANGKYPGAIGVDIRRTGQVDIVADARWLPFQDGCIDHVYSAFLLEHFTLREVQRLLKEFVRVLKKDAILEIRVPDLRARGFLFFLNPTWKNVINIYGSEADYSHHKCGFSYRLLKQLLKRFGVTKVKRVMDGGRFSFIPRDLHVKGIASNLDVSRGLEVGVGQNSRGHF